MLHFTSKLNVIAALLPGPWNPAIAAKQIASIDQYTNGYVHLRILYMEPFRIRNLDIL